MHQQSCSPGDNYSRDKEMILAEDWGSRLILQAGERRSETLSEVLDAFQFLALHEGNLRD